MSDTAETVIERTRSALADVAGCLAFKSRQVEVKVIRAQKTVVFELFVPSSDMVQVLGRGSKTLGALREVVERLGERAQLNFLLEVVERPPSGAASAALEW